VDILGGAVHVAAVSLYLAALELDPKPGIGNGVKFWPLIYPRDDEARRERPCFNLFEDDAFDPDASFSRQPPFARRQIAVAVGNPPWTRPAGARSEKLEAETAETPSHVTYCQERGIRLPNQDPADQAFFWRVADFALPDARLGLILSARRFFSHDEDSVAAKRDLLLRFAPTVMINLSELHREKVFPTAQHPAMVVVARNQNAEKGDDCTYAAVERARSFRGHGVLEIGPESIKRVSIFRAAHDEDFLKIASWGSARDAALIRHISQFPSLEQFLEKRDARPRQGFIRGDVEKRTRPVPKEIRDWPCLETEGLTAFGMTAAGLPKLKDEAMQWPRDADIYRGPMFLFTLTLSEKGLSAAVCLDNLVYSQRYYGLPFADPQGLEWADYLNGILNSTLATYFIFLTGSVWGVERDDVVWADFRRLPIPPLDEAGDLADRVVQLARQMRVGAIREAPVSPTQYKRLNEAVLDLYRLEPSNAVLVEDMLDYTIDWQRRGDESKALNRPGTDALAVYAEHFMQVVDEFLGVRGQRKAVAEVLELPKDCPLQVIRFALVPRSSRGQRVKVVGRQELAPLLQRISRELPQEIAMDVHTRRHVRFYGPGEVYLIKPAQLRFWTRSAGMNDADAVLAEHLGNVR
jgi:hypothetical protein